MRGQDRHDARAPRNPFQAVREDTVNRSRIGKGSSDKVGRGDDHIGVDRPIHQDRMSCNLTNRETLPERGIDCTARVLRNRCESCDGRICMHRR